MACRHFHAEAAACRALALVLWTQAGAARALSRGRLQAPGSASTRPRPRDPVPSSVLRPVVWPPWSLKPGEPYGQATQPGVSGLGSPPGCCPPPTTTLIEQGRLLKGQRASCNGVSRSLVLAKATAVAGAAVWGRGTAERTGRRAAGHGRPPPSSSSLCGEGTRFTPLTLREEEATGRGAASGGAGLRGECPAF